MVGSMIDVTSERALEETLRRSQRMEALGQLTGGLAHDFNNLLTVILGNAEMLVEALGHDEQLRGLADMTRMAAERGSELTSRLLAFARRQPLDPRPTDVNRLISGLDGLLRRTLGEHVEVEIVHGGGLWPALVDGAQLESAVLNLCINARDAMPGGGRLTIELANAHLDIAYADLHDEVVPGQYVLVAVSDTGVGMSAETTERAFDPFFTTKSAGGGSGLGLSMVHGFIKQSQGHVKIYSELGEGTTVKLYLPRAARGAAALESRPTPAPTLAGSERILLVEDDELVREHVADQLRDLGYQVTAAADGQAALVELRSDAPFDLLFTDVVMPGGISGRQLADEAQRLRPGLPVLFTSGYTENAIVHQGRLDPGVQLLQKPYRRGDLAMKLRKVLDKAGRG
jgi:nitrogen-specific signal transduction histidine kinase